ncbi:MAG TPA: Gfo/Idh/MocA family oxidoreductase [Planctomycetota bacterium]|nr:Gfo/Idh/MocA family oxidoreductase [Planctomycetota bacterium]
MNTPQQFKFAVFGAGNRGNWFANWIKQHPEYGKVVAVAEPDEERRTPFARAHAIAPALTFECWEELLAQPKLCDVIINTTLDPLHAASTIGALGKGYHVMLEKPMAPTLKECVAVDRARRESNCFVSICHGTYSPGVVALRALLEERLIGRVLSFDVLHGVDHLHHAAAFVRGVMGREAACSSMLLQKCSHDFDGFRYLFGKKCLRVASFGELTYFRRENAPEGAPEHCIDGCPAEASCPYSTNKVYEGPNPHWTSYFLAGKTPQQRREILSSTPVGRCVFKCSNDVVDHQVVSMQYEDDLTGTFTMTGLAPVGACVRVRIHGTRGMIELGSDAAEGLHHHCFVEGTHRRIKLPEGDGSHGGTDANFVVNFVDALRANDPTLILSGTAEALESHRVVFAAERSRQTRRMVELAEMQSAENLTANLK